MIYGFKGFTTVFRMAPELICTLIYYYAIALWLASDFQLNVVTRLLELVIFLRIIKLLTLLSEINSLKVIIETAKNLSLPLVYLGGVLFTIMYMFAVLGMLLFGGLVYQSNPKITLNNDVSDSYHLINFNDLLSSMVTLFALMVVNNWPEITQLFVQVSNLKNNVKFFFALYYFFAVVIGINIVVAFAIDMYTSVERLNR